VRGALDVRRVGHAGTLDPFATGVLPVCIGKATRLLQFLTGGEKVYSAEIQLGWATSTDDRTGEALGPTRPAEVPDDRVREACRALTGEQQQLPPAYAARRVAGRRQYELAREGVAFERRSARVEVHAFDLLSREGARLRFEIRCSPGTYVRSLARDLGERLGVGAHLAALRRTRSGGFGLDGAVSWDELQPGLAERVAPLASLLRDLPAVRVGADGASALRHGRDLAAALVSEGFPTAPPPERVRVLGESGALLALAVPRGFAGTAELPMVPVLHADIVLVD
jgi:tRNA pseudouridine55 synthase